MTFIDIAIYAVPTARKQEYLVHSKAMIGLFTKHGALSAVDCWGEDVPEGKVTSLPMAVKCEPGETVVYSHIIWADKAARDAGMGAAMADMQAMDDAHEAPFDGQRMIFGGFEVVVSA